MLEHHELLFFCGIHGIHLSNANPFVVSRATDALLYTLAPRCPLNMNFGVWDCYVLSHELCDQCATMVMVHVQLYCAPRKKPKPLHDA